MTNTASTKLQTTQIMTLFNQAVDKTKVYSRNELGKMLTTIYNNVLFEEKKKSGVEKKQKSEEKEPKKTANKNTIHPFNQFVKEHMPHMKKKFPNATPQEKLKKISELWNEKKNAQLNAPVTRSKTSTRS